MNFRRFRSSITEIIGDHSDDNIDVNLSNLYGDSASLDKRCSDSMCRYDIPTSSPTSGAQLLRKEECSRSPESVIEELPNEYFEADFDPLENTLIELSTWQDLDEVSGKLRLMDKMEEADTDKDVIISHLTTMIESNYDDLMNCIRNVQSIGDDLCRAEIEVINGRKKMRSFCGIIETGALHITNLQRKREKLQEIADTIKSLKALKDIHKAMASNMTTGEIGKSADFAKSVLECLRNDSYDKFVSLRTIEESMQKSIYLIRQKADKALKRLCCRKFAISEYENIVKSYLILDYLNETQGVELSNEQLDDFYIDAFPCVEGISQRINRFQLKDTEECLRTAVMEYIYASQHKKQKSEAEWSLNLGGMNNLDLVDLTDMPLNMLYRRLASDMAAPCVVRACELLADSIHTHFLITQWHLSPFNGNNHDTVYLHQTTIDHISVKELKKSKKNRSKQLLRDVLDFGDEDEDLSEEQRLAKLLRQSIDKSLEVHFDSSQDERDDDDDDDDEDETPDNEFTRTHPLDSYADKLVVAFNQLRDSRKYLWDEVLRSLVEMLNMINLTSAVKPDDYLAMVWAMNSMIKLGKEFCDSDSLLLRTCLDEKSKEYFQNFHLESFQIIRSMVEAESWHAFPINLAEYGGIVGIIKMNVSRDADISDIGEMGATGQDSPHSNPNTNKSPASQGRRRASINFQHHDQKISSLDSPPDKGETGLNGKSVGVSNRNSNTSGGKRGETTILSLFVKGNPFHFMTNDIDGNSSNKEEDSSGSTSSSSSSNSSSSNSSSSSCDSCDDSDSSKRTGGFWALLSDEALLDDGSPRAMSHRSQQSTSMVVTQVAFNGLSKYVSKYLHMMYLLPSVAPEIFSCLCQLFDYYLLQVFHGFVPSEEKTKFLSKPTKMTVTSPDQSLDYESLQTYLTSTLTEVVTIGILSKKSGTSSRSNTVSDDNGGSDFNSPSPPTTPSSGIPSVTSPSSDAKSLLSSSNTYESCKFSSLMRIPEPIAACDATTHYALNDRIVAAESCWFVAMILNEIKAKILKLLPVRCHSNCNSYIEQLQVVAGQLRALVYKSMCPQLIRHNSLLPQITDKSCGWDSKELRDSNHEWVDALVTSCREVWLYIVSTDSCFAESSMLVREQVWLELCQSAFDVVLEGYSRVRRCSGEGRAAMTMDLHTLHQDLNQVHLCRPPRGKHHIGNYLRCSQMSDDEMMAWIQENYQSYAYRHTLGLLAQTLQSSVLNNKKLKDATFMIDTLYDVQEKTAASTATRRTSLFSRAASNDRAAGSESGEVGSATKLSNLLPQSFRRTASTT